MLCVTGCSTVSPLVQQRAEASAVCRGLEGPLDALNAAVLADGGPQSQDAADQVLTVADAGC